MRKVTGSWELRNILQLTDIEALERVHEELGRRIATLRRLSERKALAHGDAVQFERKGQTIVGTLYRRAGQEAWVKGHDGVVYMCSMKDLEVPAPGSLCPPDTAPATMGQGRR